jgi:hypothetical protein
MDSLQPTAETSAQARGMAAGVSVEHWTEQAIGRQGGAGSGQRLQPPPLPCQRGLGAVTPARGSQRPSK